MYVNNYWHTGQVRYQYTCTLYIYMVHFKGDKEEKGICIYPPNPPCQTCLRGPPELPGDKGAPGEPGKLGERGYSCEPEKIGDQGTPGNPGLPGAKMVHVNTSALGTGALKKSILRRPLTSSLTIPMHRRER